MMQRNGARQPAPVTNLPERQRQRRRDAAAQEVDNVISRYLWWTILLYIPLVVLAHALYYLGTASVARVLLAEFVLIFAPLLLLGVILVGGAYVAGFVQLVKARRKRP